MNIYAEAAQLLLERGWTTGGPEVHKNKTGPVCMMEAVAQVQGKTICREGIYDNVVAEEARVLGFASGLKAAFWNDEQKSVVPVLARLRDAARAIEVGKPEKEIEVPAQQPWEEELTIPEEWPETAPAPIPDPEADPVKEPEKVPG